MMDVEWHLINYTECSGKDIFILFLLSWVHELYLRLNNFLLIFSFLLIHSTNVYWAAVMCQDTGYELDTLPDLVGLESRV